MTTTQNLHGAKILVTGATGFIGGRLTDYLVSHYKADVRTIVRNYGRAARIARYPVELMRGDLLNAESLQQAAEGCDIVFHCAFSPSGTEELRRRVTVDGTKNMLDAAVAANVKRFVHVSTIAVHGADPGPVVDEDSPLPYTGDVYGDAKIDAEKLISQYQREQGLSTVIMRPTIVYGPRAGGWTVGPVSNMKRDKLTLIDGGSGVANHVYIDDVVQALLLAASKPEAVGETFIVSHGTGVTWKEFFGYYTRLLGITLPDLPVQTITEQRERLAQLQSPLNKGLSFVASPHAQSVMRELPGMGSALDLADKVFPSSIKQSVLDQATVLRETKLDPPSPPRQWLVDLFCAKGICKIDKARQILGYEPQFSLEKGMQRTEAWLRHVKLV